MTQEAKVEAYKKVYALMKEEPGVSNLGYPEEKQDFEFFATINQSIRFNYILRAKIDLLTLRAEWETRDIKDEDLNQMARDIASGYDGMMGTAYNGKLVLMFNMPLNGRIDKDALSAIEKKTLEFVRFVKTEIEKKLGSANDAVVSENKTPKIPEVSFDDEEQEYEEPDEFEENDVAESDEFEDHEQSDTMEADSLEDEAEEEYDVSALEIETEAYEPEEFEPETTGYDSEDDAPEDYNPEVSDFEESADEGYFDDEQVEYPMEGEEENTISNTADDSAETESVTLELPMQTTDVQEFYASLNQSLRDKQDQLSFKESLLNEKDALFEQKEKEMRTRSAELLQKEQDIENARREADARLEEIQAEEETLSKRKEELEQQNINLLLKEDEIKKREDALKAKVKQVESREQSIRDRENSLYAQKQTVRKNLEQVQAIKKEFESKEAELSKRENDAFEQEQRAVILNKQNQIDRDTLNSKKKDIEKMMTVLEELRESIKYTGVDQKALQGELQAKEEEIREISEQVAALQEEIASRDDQIERLNSDILKRNAAIQKLDTIIKNKNTLIQEKEEIIRQKEELLKERVPVVNTTVVNPVQSEDQSGKIQELQEMLDEANHTIAELKENLTKKEELNIEEFTRAGYRAEYVIGEGDPVITFESDGCTVYIHEKLRILCIEKETRKKPPLKELEAWNEEDIAESYTIGRNKIICRKVFKNPLDDMRKPLMRLKDL